MTSDAAIKFFRSRAIGLRLVAVITIALLSAGPGAAQSSKTIEALIARLDAAQRSELALYRAARARHDAALQSYWSTVATRRTERRRKLRAGGPIGPEDYVLTFPPEYSGPRLSPAIARIWAEIEKEERPPREPIPSVEDVLASAKAHYGFVPERISEREFKWRYAFEALAVGLTKEQIVRIYALETGGQGTYDMQAGISPITRRGTPISTALGYAQLLHANSVNELVNHGAAFARRLDAMANAEPHRAAALRAKARIVRSMLQNARSVPYDWYEHMRYAATPKGLGIHALNIDADVGPWLQVIKLKGIRDEALRAGRASLAPVEMELMNLAGPSTGLEMMLPVARNVPTSNFFSRGGYERNSIVRGRTAAELLAALDKRMDENERKPGAVEFAAVFDEVARMRQARR
jgi:hypothetical protein